MDTFAPEGSPNNPRQIVRLIITDPENEGHIFVTRDIRPNKGHSFLPGGGIEEGENPEAAAKRELLEEAGIGADAVESVTPLFQFPHQWDNDGTPFHEVNHVMTCTIEPSALRAATSQETHLAFEWLPTAEIRNEQQKFRPQEMVNALMDALPSAQPRQAPAAPKTVAKPVSTPRKLGS